MSAAGDGCGPGSSWNTAMKPSILKTILAGGADGFAIAAVMEK